VKSTVIDLLAAIFLAHNYGNRRNYMEK